MVVSRRWKHEKDVFGRRHRKYFLENIFGADAADMQTFRALKTKLNRDYLGFFGNLSKAYERGEYKKMAKKSMGIAFTTLSILNNMIETGIVSKDSVATVVENVNNLNASRDFFVQQSEQVKALKGRMDKIQEETGISTESLNVTEEMITKGARRERKKIREGALPFLARTMPRTLGLGAELARGAGVAALGPLYPLAGMAGGALQDILGLGRGIAQKVGERKQAKLGKALSPLAYGLPEEEMRRVGAMRRRGPGLSQVGLGGQRKKEGVGVLSEFFNRGAYRAKWTRELLKKMKEAGRRGAKDFGLLGIVGKLKALAPALLLLAGKAGLFASLGVGVGLSISKFIELKDAIVDYNKVMKYTKEAQERWMKVMNKWSDHLDTLLEKEKVESKRAEKVISSIRERIETREFLLQTSPTQILGDPFGDPTAPPAEVKKELVPRQRRFPAIAGTPTPATQTELLNQVKRLAEVIASLSENLGKGQDAPSIRESGLGNPFDSSDHLLNDYAGAKLGLQED